MRSTVLFLYLLCSMCLEAGAQGNTAVNSPGQLNLRFARMLSIKVNGGPEARLLEAKPGKWEGNLIVYLHGKGGINQLTAARVEELARRSGAAIICPDLLFYRGQADSVASDSLRMVEIVRSCIEYGGKSCRIQVLAWGDPGCSLVLKAAAVVPDRFYGAVLVDGLPAADTALMAQLQGPLMLLRNKAASPVRTSVRDAFSLQMGGAGKVFRLTEFAAVGRSVVSAPAINEVDEASWQSALEFLKQNFQEPMRRNIPAKP